MRRDGSPRISGIEITFDDGELRVGSMWRAVKALDLQRDPRFGDAKLAGRAEEIRSDQRSHRFRADITELVVTSLGGDAPTRRR